MVTAQAIPTAPAPTIVTLDVRSGPTKGERENEREDEREMGYDTISQHPFAFVRLEKPLFCCVFFGLADCKGE
jgi:hypothetical protein